MSTDAVLQETGHHGKTEKSRKAIDADAAMKNLPSFCFVLIFYIIFMSSSAI